MWHKGFVNVAAVALHPNSLQEDDEICFFSKNPLFFISFTLHVLPKFMACENADICPDRKRVSGVKHGNYVVRQARLDGYSGGNTLISCFLFLAYKYFAHVFISVCVCVYGD